MSSNSNWDIFQISDGTTLLSTKVADKPTKEMIHPYILGNQVFMDRVVNDNDK
jgi:hypothetical protein